MPIVFQCLHCGSVFAAPDGLAGQRARCQGCRGVVEVPLASLDSAIFAQPQLMPVPAGLAQTTALVPVQPQLKALGPDPLMELLGPRPVRAQSGLPAKWIIGGGVGLACAIITFALITWGMNRGRPDLAQGPTTGGAGSGFIREPTGPRNGPASQQTVPTTQYGPSFQTSPQNTGQTSSPFEQVESPRSSSPPSGSGSSSNSPGYSPRRSGSTSSTFSGSSSASTPVPSSSIPSPVEVGAANATNATWSVTPDPPTSPIELKAGDFKVPLTGAQPKIIFPHHPSRFVLAWTGDNSRPECTMYDLKTGLAVGKKVSIFGLDPHKALVSGDGRYVAMTRLDEGRDQHRLRLAAVSFASGEGQPRIEIKCSEFHKALFAASHRVVTAHSVGQRYSSNQNRFLTHWDVQTGKSLREINLNELDVNEGARLEFFEVSPGGKYVAFPRDEEIVLIELEAGTVAARLPISDEARGQARLTFAPDGSLLASIEGSSYRADLRVFDMSTGKLVVDEPIETKTYGLNWHSDELSWLPANSGLFIGGQVLLELTSAREAWNFPRSRGEPRRIMRNGEMITLGADRNKTYLYSAPLPQKQIDSVFDAMRVRGGAAEDVSLPTFTQTDLAAAPRIDPPTASIAWSYTPDPAPITERTDQREFQVSDEFSHLTTVRFASAAPRVVVQRLPSSGQSMIEIYDSAGKKLHSVEVPREYRLIDVSPSGQRGLIGIEKEQKWDRLDCISLEKKQHVAGWRPYGQEDQRGQARADLVEWAAFAGEDHIVTNNSQGKLVGWQMPDCKPLYAFQRFGTALAMSGGRKYLLGAEGNNLRIFEAPTGRCVGQLPVEHGAMIAKGGAFRADGSEIAVSFATDTDHFVGRWNATTGRPDDEAPVRGSGSVEYCSNDYLLLEGKRLFDVAKRRVVWRYLMGSGGQRVAGSADSRTWYTAGKTQNDGSRHLTSFAVPSDDVKRKTADRRFESQFLLKPGDNVRIDVQLGEVGLTDMQPLVEQQLRDALESRGFRVSETAGPTVSLVAIERSSGYKIVANLPNGIVNLPGLVQVDEKDVVYHLTLSDAAGRVIWGLDQRVGMTPITMVKVDDPATAVRARMIDEFKASLSKASGFIRSDLPRYVFLPTPGDELSVLAFREERPPQRPSPEEMNLGIRDVRPPPTFPAQLSIGRLGREKAGSAP